MSAVRHILVLVVLSCMLFACGKGPRVIPRSVMADIYADMFMADQWLSDHPSERSRTDTTLFYDPIFESYGYTFEDYDYSVRHYLKDPEKFAKMLRKVTDKLKDGSSSNRKMAEKMEMIREFNAQIKGYSEKDFHEDTILWRSPYKDSILAALAAAADSTLADSTRTDTVRVDSAKILITNLHKYEVSR